MSCLQSSDSNLDGAGELVYAAADQIPLFGTVLSFVCSVGAAWYDPGNAVKFALDGFQGLVRDTVFIATDGAGVSWHLAIAHDVTKAVSDAGVSLLFKDNNATVSTHNANGDNVNWKREDKNITIAPDDPQKDALPGYAQAKRDGKFDGNGKSCVQVLIPHHDESTDWGDKVKQEVENAIFRRTFKLYGTVFVGKFTKEFEKGKYYAENENVFLTFPTGFHEKGHCHILTTFSEDAKYKKNREMIIINTPIKITGDADFEVLPSPPGQDGGWYGWKGKILSFNEIELALYFWDKDNETWEKDTTATITELKLRLSNTT